MGRALTSRRIAFPGLRWRNARAYASWLGFADICSLLSPSFPGHRASACGGAFRPWVSIQEFADLHPNSSLRIPCPCIPVEPTSTLASEGVELEFRWVIQSGKQQEMLREDEEGDVAMSKADTFLPDTC